MYVLAALVVVVAETSQSALLLVAQNLPLYAINVVPVLRYAKGACHKQKIYVQLLKDLVDFLLFCQTCSCCISPKVKPWNVLICDYQQL